MGGTLGIRPRHDRVTMLPGVMPDEVTTILHMWPAPRRARSRIANWRPRVSGVALGWGLTPRVVLLARANWRPRVSGVALGNGDSTQLDPYSNGETDTASTDTHGHCKC